MSDVDNLASKLAGLRGEHDVLASTPTKEDAQRRAQAWLEAAQARAVESGGLVANGHATGEALQAVLAAFVLSDPRLPDWLTAGQDALVGGLTEHAKVGKLKKLGAEIAAVEKELLATRKQLALEQGRARVQRGRVNDRLSRSFSPLSSSWPLLAGCPLRPAGPALAHLLLRARAPLFPRRVSTSLAGAVISKRRSLARSRTIARRDRPPRGEQNEGTPRD